MKTTTLPNEIQGIKIYPVTQLKTKAGRPGGSKYVKLIQNLPPGAAFMVPKKKVQNMYIAAKVVGVRISVIRQDNGLFAVFRKEEK